jgi:hypothetical protein
MRSCLFGLIIASQLASSVRADDNKTPAGFVALFNGKDTTGWQAAIRIDQRLKLAGEDLEARQKKADQATLAHWTVQDGVLVNDGKGGNLATVKHFGNFELLVDWKIEPKGDSGIYLRGLPQVQIWDSDCPEMKRFEKDIGKGSGSLWNNTKDNVPLKKADKAPGEWNSLHITMKGDQVSVRLNGELVADKVAIENAWKKGDPVPVRGPIELQAHPKQDGSLGRLWFKNVSIKELD